ncbi:MAG: hypothetical protein E6738_00445 [Campylobacter concisus]|nr:hypothetical protein [Campylobacter concisus]MDU2008096.1 hypothetical protein [Campylobacter concisus]
MMKKIARGFSKNGTSKIQKTPAKSKRKNMLSRVKSSIEKDKVSPDKNPKNTPLNKNM